MSAIIKFEEKHDLVADLDSTQKVCQALMRTPHYAKMGEAGLFAIVQKAKSMGMNPLEALNGGMYFVQGKVEMQGQSMLALIRQRGHSVSLDAKSTATHVTMHGKRADNGDSWTVEFGIEDAKRAGIYRGQWEKYPKTMCMWRCVSMLARFLFSDVIKGVYVQDEISEAIPFESKVDYQEAKVEHVPIEKISSEQAVELMEILSECSEEYQDIVTNFMKRGNIASLYELPIEAYKKLKTAALKKRAEFAEFAKSVKQSVPKVEELTEEELQEAVKE